MSDGPESRAPGHADKAGAHAKGGRRNRPADREIVISPAEDADAQAAARITRDAFDGVSIDQAMEKALGRRGKVGWRDLKGREVRNEFEQTPGSCFVAKSAGRVVGFVTTGVDSYASCGRIVNLAVAASWRERGIGRQLIQRALDHFRALGLKQAKIEPLTTNPVGQHLYPATGFKEVARQIHYVMAL